MTPAVSVVIPCFNLGAYLDEAVQSVLNQTFDDVEILIVDDGSDDEATRHLLASYRRPRTRILRTENRGLAAARNLGIEESQGRYLSFLDADDLFEPRFLEETISRLEADGSLTFASTWLRAFGEREFDWEPERCDFPWLLAEDTVCTPAPVRREAIVAVGGFDADPRAAGNEDWALAVALVDAGFRGEIVREHLFRYRIRAGSMSSWCTLPEHHMGVFAYLMDTHEAAYEAHADGVAEAIGRRTTELEALLGEDAPSRPEAGSEGWRQRLMTAERHRRALEERLEQRVDRPGPDADRAVEWGGLRRLEPVSRVWGLDRGTPVDRFYIDRFLADNAEAIAGDVLEVKDPGYTRAYGERARSVTVVDIAEHNPQATLVADLTAAGALPGARYDCAVLTQTVHLVYDFGACIRNVHEALAPGGTLLATLPCVSRVDYETGVDQDFWRFTAASARRLFAEVFEADAVEVASFGNVLACTAFLQGVAAQELSDEELDDADPYFPLLIGVRARRAPAADAVARDRAVSGSLDEVTCASISGWAFDRSAPEQRLQMEVLDGDRMLGRAWAATPRDDLAEAGLGDGRLAFRLEVADDLHREPPAQVRARVVGEEQDLTGSPRELTCVCGESAGLAGSTLEQPEVFDGAAWLDVSGWALGARSPVEAVELLHDGRPFRSVAVGGSRPDIQTAFPDVPWAARSGFSTRVNLGGIRRAGELEVRARLSGGRHATLGRFTASEPTGPRVVLAGGEELRDDERLGPPFAQNYPTGPVILRGRGEAPPHPGFTPAASWGRAFDRPGDLVWLVQGDERVGPGFVETAVSALEAEPAASFAVARATDPRPGVFDELVPMLSGTGLGAAVLFRASVGRAVGGVDDAAPSAVAAAWDLAVRLVEAGHSWVEVEGGTPVREDLAVTAGEAVARWLYGRHASLFATHLPDVLLDRERLVGGLLRDAHAGERELESAGIVVQARRRERDRLSARLRRAREGARRTDPWGDFRRAEPLGPLWGSERGVTVDRFYIEAFLERHRDDIRGDVLGCSDAVYQRRYGTNLRTCDVLDLDASNPHATVVADLRRAPEIAGAQYDCVILTQMLQYVDDVDAALREVRRILRPGGVLLATVPAAGRTERAEGLDGELWRFSAAGVRDMLSRTFATDEVEVRSEGNRHAVLGFVVGLAAEEVGIDRLRPADPASPLVVTFRVRRGDR